jgi:hypothetical protein
MISARICNIFGGATLRSFADNITTRVCLPDGAQPQLALTVQEPGYLHLESDGQAITVLPVDPTTRAIPLADLLNGRNTVAGINPLRSALTAVSRSRSGAIRAFKLVISKDRQGRDVAATFDFHLMPRTDFESALSDFISSRRCQSASPLEVQRQLEPPARCWNCENPGVISPCPECGADQED